MEDNNKQNILVLISQGGGGHQSAGESLHQILSDTYNVDIVNAINSVITPLDWFHTLSFGKISGETIYNFLLQHEFYRMLKFYVNAGSRHMQVRKKKVAKIFHRYLKQLPKRPDLIISTIPLINDGLLTASHQLGIPYLLIPTDLDTSPFLQGFNQLDRKFLSRFQISLPYERPEIIWQVFKNSLLEPQHLAFTGFPVRPSCQHTYTKEEILELKKHSGMLTDRKTISLIVGAAGGNSIFEHTKNLANLTSDLCGAPLQANICVGRNRKVKKRIIDWVLSDGGKIIVKGEDYTSLSCRKGIILHIRAFTNEIIKILACSDLIISKTGSCTVNEAIYLGKKLLLDNSPSSTAQSLRWEQFNVHFVKRHGFGAAFSESDQLLSIIPFMLQNPSIGSKPFKLPDFQHNIRKLVSSLLH